MIYNPDLDINQLRAFVTVAELKSFTRAALRLNRTQSAVSMQVRRLEQNMGRSLLTRTKGGVGLTESGRVVLEYARRILKLNDEVMAEIGDPEVKGRVRLGIPDDYAAYLLPGALSGFGSLYPGISLEVYCELSVDLLRLIEDGEVDLALFPDGVCVFRESALKALRSCGRRWRIVCTSRGLAGIRAVVTSAMAITVVTENTVSPNMQVIAPESGLPALPKVDICLHVSRSPGNEAVTVFADYISRSLKNC